MYSFFFKKIFVYFYFSNFFQGISILQYTFNKKLDKLFLNDHNKNQYENYPDNIVIN